ncbi:HET domain-containing protein [Teratosphaeria destructans]|uniref:HET domain-containing protein n=1 Tax=Teratosphaeria destructans TaxID=418781 RepID=A0A9W7W6D2_9PEZI|nr:HET domain-containing protein [Teratosphaeria destructans]
MSILYGEGRGAFRRLQEEFLRSSADLSILIWSLPPYDLRFERGALAPGPEGFVCWAGQRSRGFHLAMAGQHVTPRPSVFTNVGLRLELPCVAFGEIPEVEAAEVFGSTRSAGDHDRSQWQLADMNARFAYGDEEHNVFLILTPLDGSGGMPDQQTPTYHVTKPPNWAIWDDRGVCVCTRLVLVPSKTRLQSTMKQVYLSVRLPLRNSSVSAWPRKIALRPGPNGVGRASEAFPAGSWDQNTGILVPCSSDGSCILRGRRVAVVHLHLEEFVVCLCFFWSSTEGHWLFLPGYALAEAFDKSVLFIDGIRTLRMTEALDQRASTEGYHRRLLLRGDVVSIEAAWEVHRGAPFHGAPSPGAPYELFVKLTPLRAIDTRDRERWAQDPRHYAPYNLETGTLHFDHDLRNEFAAKEWAELLPNRDCKTEVWPYVKDFRSLESSKELIALYFDPLWCYKHRLVPIGDGHGRSMRGTEGPSSPPPRAAGDTTSGETDRGSLVEDGDDDQKSKRRVPDGSAEVCLRIGRRRSM